MGYIGDYALPAGSSPSTRGAHGGLEPYGVDNGLIPVYAGSTGQYRRGPFPPTAHPRLRGEHRPSVSVMLARVGSSPSTRGAPEEDERGLKVTGLIPVYAGSTDFRGLGDTPTAAHPRLRGEHRVTFVAHIATTGSSPSTRGALVAGGSMTYAPRLIPVYAGSTSPMTQ